MPYKYFADEELACKCGCGRGADDMDAEFMRKLIAMREELDFPFQLSSAFRCPDHNEKESSTGRDGPHTTGHAVDILASGHRAYEINAAAPRYGMTGIGPSQKGPHGNRFMHLDDLASSVRPWIWTY